MDWLRQRRQSKAGFPITACAGKALACKRDTGMNQTIVKSINLWPSFCSATGRRRSSRFLTSPRPSVALRQGPETKTFDKNFKVLKLLQNSCWFPDEKNPTKKAVPHTKGRQEAAALIKCINNCWCQNYYNIQHQSYTERQAWKEALIKKRRRRASGNAKLDFLIQHVKSVFLKCVQPARRLWKLIFQTHLFGIMISEWKKKRRSKQFSFYTPDFLLRWEKKKKKAHVVICKSLTCIQKYFFWTS